jgi:hypothetical protein
MVRVVLDVVGNDQLTVLGIEPLGLDRGADGRQVVRSISILGSNWDSCLQHTLELHSLAWVLLGHGFSRELDWSHYGGGCLIPERVDVIHDDRSGGSSGRLIDDVSLDGRGFSHLFITIFIPLVKLFPF